MLTMRDKKSIRYCTVPVCIMSNTAMKTEKEEKVKQTAQFEKPPKVQKKIKEKERKSKEKGKEKRENMRLIKKSNAR